MTTPTKKAAKVALAAVLGTALGGALVAAPKEAKAQEIQLTGPLAGAPAVRGMRLYRKQRFEVAPMVAFSLLDEYRRTIITGARLQYNVTDWFAFGLWGGYAAGSLQTDLTDQIDQHAPRNSRTASNVNNNGVADANGNLGARSFGDQTAKIQWVAAPQVQFTPFRGKLALFQSLFVDTDAYLHAGVAFVGLQERGDCGGGGTQLSCSDPNSFDRVSRVAIAPTFGIGLNFYLTNFISLGVEYRALPFSWNRAGFDTRGTGSSSNFPDGKIDSEDRTFKFNQMMSVSLGFSFPTKPQISQ